MNSFTAYLRRPLGLLVALLASSAFAQPTVSVTVAGNQIAGTGSALVSLNAAGVENNVTFTLSWDPAVLQYVSDTKGDRVASYLFNRSQTASGKLSLQCGLNPDAKYPAGANDLATVTFTAVAPSARTAIALIDGTTLTPPLARKRVFDTQGTNLTAATFTDATVTVR